MAAITFAIGLHTLSAQDIHMSLSPNPASTHVLVQTEESVTGTVTVAIFSILGTQVGQNFVFQSQGEKSFNINTAGLAEGVYLVRITHGKSSDVKRLKIQP